MKEDTPLFSRSWVQLGLVVAVGLYLFTVCAAFISRDPVKPDVSYAVLGPEIVQPKTTFPIRVAAYVHDKGTRRDTTITRAVIDDGVTQRELKLDEATSGLPAMMHIGPAPERRGPFKVILTVESPGQATRELEVPFVVFDVGIVDVPGPLGLPDEIPREGDLLVEILTEGPGLAMAMSNRVWFRITDRDGNAAPGAQIRWSSKGTEPASGAAETDAAGLADIELVPNNLSTKFHVEVERGEQKGLLEETHRPLGRGVMLLPRRLVKAPGEPEITMHVLRANPDATAYCDLYRGVAWIRTWHLPPGHAANESVGDVRVSTFTVALDEPDTYRFQCYTHYHTPGDGGDATYLFYDSDPRIKAMTHLLRGDPNAPQAPSTSGRSGTYRRSVPVIGEPGQRALMANYRTRMLDVTPPAVVHNTRSDDLESARISDDTARIRFFLLIGASFALVILWSLYYALNVAVENRTRMAEAIRELGDMAVDVPEPTHLMVARKAVQVGFIVLVLILNIAGMIELFRVM